MRVDIGIVLSVLSFSALAKVIPNDDSHGPLLVRRAVGPDTTDLLWKRADGDDEQEPSHMDSVTEAEADVETSNDAETDAGASSDGSSPDHPSGSGELSELDQTLDSAEELYRPSQKQLLTQRPKYMPRSDKESIQKAVTKVTEAFEGENKEEFVTEVEVLLTNALSSARRSLAAYNSKDTAPFYLIISKGATDQQSLIKKMHATGPRRRGIALGIPSCFGGHEHGSAVGTMILAKIPNFTPECLWIVGSVYVGHSGATTNYSRREAFASIRQSLDRVVPFDNNHPVLILETGTPTHSAFSALSTRGVMV
ncbi:hypothetical protein BASA81_014686 [Batrachochytrium salamandrivorans]|nr:hypothetical protein BASA81_014686 [Batrachochytrium salamandrivorans]